MQVIYYHVTGDLDDMSFEGLSRKTVLLSNRS